MPPLRRPAEDEPYLRRCAVLHRLHVELGLRRELADLIDTMFERFAEIAVNDLIRRGELDKSRRDEILARRYTEEQVLQDWFPGGETPHSQC